MIQFQIYCLNMAHYFFTWLERFRCLATLFKRLCIMHLGFIHQKRFEMTLKKRLNSVRTVGITSMEG